MARPNKVKTSRYREKIDNWIIEGKGDTKIIELLKQQDPPEKIGRTTLYNYRKNDFNINKEATLKYNEKKSKERLENASDKVVSDLEYCDNLIDLAHKVHLQVDHENKITELDIKKLGLQAVKTKQEILQQGEPEDKNVRVEIVVVDSDEDDTMETQSKTGN